MDHKHQEFVSGDRACVDPPHLRMVFDEAVVSSLAPQAAAQAPTEPSSADTQPSRDGSGVGPVSIGSASIGPASVGSASSVEGKDAQSDSTRQSCLWQRQSGTAATVETAGADAGVGAGVHAEPAQHQDRRLVFKETGSQLSSVPALTVHKADSAWQAVLQRAMQLAQDTKWTHKGLQASAVSCLVRIQSMSP